MKRYYFCPHCDALLNPGEMVVLVARAGGRAGLILLDPRPGNYDKRFDDARLSFAEGESLELLCPVCQRELSSERGESLAEVNFRSGDGDLGTVLFSRRFGEQATYCVTEEHVESFGKDASPHGAMNFFGAGKRTSW